MMMIGMEVEIRAVTKIGSVGMEIVMVEMVVMITVGVEIYTKMMILGESGIMKMFEITLKTNMMITFLRGSFTMHHTFVFSTCFVNF